MGILPNKIWKAQRFSLQLVQMFPVYYIFNFLMTLLLVLHVIWFTFLSAIVVQVKKDTKRLKERVALQFWDIVFIFQVYCADKDNIEDVRSGSEAEVDSESDAPRKER